MRSLLILAVVLVGCADLPPPRPAVAQSDAGKALAEEFWSSFHDGRYVDIDALLEKHMQLVVAEPSDPITVSHAGWLHAWKLSEATRAPRNAGIVASATLARRYFREAVALSPEDARYLGFYAGFTMSEGSILENEAQVTQGYFTMQEAVSRWPEFNLFTSGYVMSRRDDTTPQFKEGLEQQWQTLDVCFGEHVSRSSPRFEKYLALETTTGTKRACWNSVIAPHNWEGFFLNFGDMLIRTGDPTNARAMYETAKLSSTFDAWPYRGVLERRLEHLDSLREQFAAAEPEERENTTMIKTAFGCMGCHQATGIAAVP